MASSPIPPNSPQIALFDESDKPKKFRDVLADDMLRSAFRDFCREEMASENFLFYEEVEDFKRIDDDGERRARFDEMYEKFFSLESDFEMNISGEDRQTLQKHKNSAEVSSDVFNRIQRKVYAELSTELMFRFLRSFQLRRVLEDKGDPEGARRRKVKLETFFGCALEVRDGGEWEVVGGAR